MTLPRQSPVTQAAWPLHQKAALPAPPTQVLTYQPLTHQTQHGFAEENRFEVGLLESGHKTSWSDTGIGATRGRRSHWWIQAPKSLTHNWLTGTQALKTRLVSLTKGSNCLPTLYISKIYLKKIGPEFVEKIEAESRSRRKIEAIGGREQRDNKRAGSWQRKDKNSFSHHAPLRPERRASETSHARLNLIVTVFTRVCMPWPIVNSPSLCREARAPAVQPELRRSPIPISLHRLGRGGDDLEG